ncbi:hypothetical protein NPIL_186631, partial [Nephila pilipes]
MAALSLPPGEKDFDALGRDWKRLAFVIQGFKSDAETLSRNHEEWAIGCLVTPAILFKN